MCVMAQRLKDHVREQITQAALEVFAAEGYQGAKVSAIASRAGLSTGNIYRYFRGKDALFYSLVDDAFVARFEALLNARVSALAGLDDVRQLDAAALAAQQQMLAFMTTHRLALVILLDRCTGSRYETFGQAFVTRLVDLTLEHLRARATTPLDDVVPFMLGEIFQTSRRALVAILENYTSEADIQHAFEAFWHFQLAGLAGFQQWAVT